jgi:hypothetical protein
MIGRLSLMVDYEVRMMFAHRRQRYVDVSLGGGCRARATGPAFGSPQLRHGVSN